MARRATPRTLPSGSPGDTVEALILAILAFSGTLLLLFLIFLFFAVPVAELSAEEDGVLVLAAPPAGAVLDEDDRVLVTGLVRPFSLAEFERGLGVDLEDETFAAWEGKPVVVALALEDRTTTRVDTTFADTPLVDLDDLHDDLDRYAGRPVTVAGEVEEVIGRRAFVLEQD